jgi:hypothetical protein
MLKLSDKQIIEYLKRCYTAVDGLWFIKLEEKSGFDTAIDIDDKVWKIMPKIQARMLKSLTKPDGSIKALIDCFEFKMAVEGYRYKIENMENNRCFSIIVKRCPWLDLIVNSHRENLAEKVGTTICKTTCNTWASEFGSNIKFELQRQKCRGAEDCLLKFHE